MKRRYASPERGGRFGRKNDVTISPLASDVFPGPVIDKESVESTYGNACPAGKAPAGPCYQKKLTDDFRTYMLYAKLGLAVFLNEDGKTVHSFIFTPQPAGK